MKSYGIIHFVEADNERDRAAMWVVEARPHIVLLLKRIFPRALPGAEWRGQRFVESIDVAKNGVVVLQDTAEVCEDLRWVLERYPMEVPAKHRLFRAAATFRRHLNEMSELISTPPSALSFDLAVPARTYQAQGAELWLRQGYLLLADHMGLGKTCTAIAGLSRGTARPALVVTLTHLPDQWLREFARFAPLLKVEILKNTSAVPDPDADVSIISYSKLALSEEAIRKRGFKSVVFDEVQELRRRESARYSAAYRIARSCKFVLGMSGTPIYNYGGEIFNVVEVLNPGFLGSESEFTEQWCKDDAKNQGKKVVKNVIELGTYLRENFMMLRRTRRDVGRELPPTIDIVHEVDADATTFTRDMQGTAEMLAQRIFKGEFVQRGQAAREFDMLLRQQTGIAKAPAVADFVRMLVADGECVVLYGYHHAVYEIWRDRLADLKPVFVTGNESTKQKAAALEAFTKGETSLLVISLRAGAGIDGLQYVSRTVVFGEYDWAPAIMDQCKTRVDRDGQDSQVTTYHLVTQFGSDPVMTGVLGIKRGQFEGIIDLGERPDTTMVEVDGTRVRKLAADFLSRRGVRVEEESVAAA